MCSQTAIKVNHNMPGGCSQKAAFMVQSPPMGFVDDMLVCLRKATEERFGGVKRRFAVAADYDPTNLGRILKGERTAWLESFGRLADAAGLRVVPADEVTGPEYTFVEKANTKLSAGGGSLENSGQIEGALAFKTTWLQSRTNNSPKKLKIMGVFGLSMSPTLDNGDIVLVDEGNRVLIPDKVYAIWKGEEVFVKRFRKIPNGYLFMGDNRERSYEDVTVAHGEDDDFGVIGRVLWAGKEL